MQGYTQPLQRAKSPIAALNPQMVQSQSFDGPFKSQRNTLPNQVNYPNQQFSSPAQFSPQQQSSTNNLANSKSPGPAFVEYLPPYYVAHVDPVVTTQTIVEKSIQVISVDQFQELWNNKITEFLDKLGKQVPKQEPVEQITQLRSAPDDGQLNDLRAKIESKDDEIDNLRNQLKQKDGLIDNLRDQLKQLLDQLNQKDQEIEDLRAENEHLHTQMETITEEVTVLQKGSSEGEIYKRRYAELNDKYHACQEQLMVKEAEYESLLKQMENKQIITTTVTTQQGTTSTKVEQS